ncbi:MAG: hypothetical protein G4V63_30550 [Candidatus Afipia apatlaquensis]|uniref:Uncharacterized protein n=1 Tax=Candidatus Afipia apatlaquensis TaxID=2712852 RepID=A0A7C9RKT2_9BRAD|nr:hypothetical protein [Candidatus Afipia apatlaquensis]
MANLYQGPAAFDFYSSLSGLGDTIQANQKLARERQLNDARKGAFTEFTALDPSSPDYGKQAMTIAQKLGAADDQDGAVKFLSVAQSNADRVRQAQRDQVADKQNAAYLSIAQRNAARADEGPVEKAAQRVKVLQQYGIDPNSPEGRAYAISGEWTGPGAGGASLNPVYGVGADGKPALIQTTKTGQAIQTKLPDGFQISKDPIRVDAGTHINLIDPQTRQVVGTLPKNIAETERQKVVGDAQGTAEVALPQVMSTSQQILKTLDDVQNHPGKKWSLGIYSKAPTIPGTEQANFRAAAGQLKGQTFLQAYQTLRGGGAITDIEGQKGENALARMDQAQTVEAYDAALNDFRDVVKAGMLRAQAKARGPSANQPSQPAGQPNVTKAGVPWSIQ